MKIFISIPQRGRPDSEVDAERTAIFQRIRKVYETEETPECFPVELIDQFYTGHEEDIEDDSLFYEGEIRFRRGSRNDPDSNSGLTDADLLEIVRDRLKDFQDGPFSCHANAVALTHVSAALHNLKARTQDRAERGVLGSDAA